MPELDQRPKVTIEDLLRLKRAERPAAEFWTTFERELRQKQLTALLEKRPWWQELPQILARRAYLPVGATAILAFTLVSVKFYVPTQLAQVPVANPSAAVDHGVALPSSPVSSPLVNRSESVVSTRDEVAVVASAAAPAAGPAEVVELMPLLVAPRATETPSARLLAANSATLDQSDADFSSAALSNRLSPPARVPATAAAEELASVPTNATRRNHLLASYGGRQLNPEPVPPAVVRERLARQLGGDTEPSDRSNRLARDADAFVRTMPQIVALRF